MLKAPKGTPREMIYLELGLVPFRDLIRGRRLGFLHSILHEDSKSLVNKFFQTQLKHRTKKDWVTTVLDDLDYLNIKELDFQTIKNIKQTEYMKIIKQKVREKSFEKLENLKKSHTKVEDVEHSCIVMQKYLQPNTTKITKDEAQLIFKLRCKVTEAKVNLKGTYDNLECGACGISEETQQHIIECKELNKNKNSENIIYSKILNGTVIETLKIAKLFKENYDKLENMMNS